MFRCFTNQTSFFFQRNEREVQEACLAQLQAFTREKEQLLATFQLNKTELDQVKADYALVTSHLKDTQQQLQSLV